MKEEANPFGKLNGGEIKVPRDLETGIVSYEAGSGRDSGVTGKMELPGDSSEELKEYNIHMESVPAPWLSYTKKVSVKAQNPEEALKKGYEYYNLPIRLAWLEITDPYTSEVLLHSKLKDLPDYSDLPPKIVGSDKQSNSDTDIRIYLSDSDTSYATRIYNSLKNLLKGVRKKI